MRDYKRKGIKLLHGDCLIKLKEIKDKSIDLILCDPPYGTTKNKWDSVIPFEPMWEQLHRIIKDNGAIVLFAQCPFDKILGFSNLKNLKYEWIWEKTTATGHLNAKKAPMRAHENILVFYKKLPTYIPIKTKGHLRKTSSSSNRSVKSCNNYGKEKGVIVYDSTERYPRSVLLFPTDKQKLNLHPTQKPVALLEYLIKTYTLKRETVLDFTMGSGSTGVACVNTKRKFIGIELDKKYFKIAKQRIREAKGGAEL